MNERIRMINGEGYSPTDIFLHFILRLFASFLSFLLLFQSYTTLVAYYMSPRVNDSKGLDHMSVFRPSRGYWQRKTTTNFRSNLFPF